MLMLCLDDVYSTAMAYLNRDALDETLARMLLLRHEADVIMVEGFYTYSIHKYRAILDTLSKVLASTPHLHHPALDQWPFDRIAISAAFHTVEFMKESM
ncbi:hypothetical protein DYB32_007654 [Aphanomyces invadans]|uniref:Uncharacterized protein n=1 Tax=Aphanomyces invadans TaxID=157072 RepID=A0A418AQN4_9STRA|nr:hypothetical protein DYB32_007654 [Aphanomyces invadans]